METLVTKKVSIVLRLNYRYGTQRENIGKSGGTVYAVRDTFCING